MPQMNKGGKFIFGWSVIQEDLTMCLPVQAAAEYGITSEGKIYLFTGSRSTGGFCVTRKELLAVSKLGHILTDLPALRDYEVKEGEFIPYKGRSYCWTHVSGNGVIRLNQDMMNFLKLQAGARLLSIRSSNIAFTMGARGPLLERARHYQGDIPLY